MRLMKYYSITVVSYNNYYLLLWFLFIYRGFLFMQIALNVTGIGRCLPKSL